MNKCLHDSIREFKHTLNFYFYPDAMWITSSIGKNNKIVILVQETNITNWGIIRAYIEREAHKYFKDWEIREIGTLTL